MRLSNKNQATQRDEFKLYFGNIKDNQISIAEKITKNLTNSLSITQMKSDSTQTAFKNLGEAYDRDG